MAASFNGNTGINIGTGRPWMRNVPGGTVMTWVRVNTLTPSFQSLIGAQGATSTTRFKLTLTGSGGFTWRCNALDADATSVINGTTGLISVGVWIHVAAVTLFNVKTGIIYVNGKADVAAVFANMTAGNTSNTDCALASIGAHENGTSNPLDGLMDDTRIYNVALSGDEIQTIYTGLGADNLIRGIQARWRLNDKSAGTIVNVADCSPNGFGGAGGTASFDQGITRSRRRVVGRVPPPRR